LLGDTAAGLCILLLLGMVPAAQAGCAGRRRVPNDTDVRFAAVERSYGAEREDAEARWAPIVEQARSVADRLLAERIALAPGTGFAPDTRVDANPSLANLKRTCGEIETMSHSKADAAENLGRLAADCRAKHGRIYEKMLRAKYRYANFAWVSLTLESDPSADIESLLTYSHNAVLGARAAEVVRAALDPQKRALDAVEERRSRARAAVQNIARAEETARRRRVARAFGAALTAYSRGMAVAPDALPAGRNLAVGTQGNACSSDFSCGIGFICVKNHFASSGFCAVAVDEYGLRQFPEPRTDTFGPAFPSSSGCHFSTDCPIGFHCDVKSGTCLK